MLESAIPALWSAVHGWFTPAVLFVVLNLVIGTIAVTSKVTASAAGREGDGAGAGGEQRRFSRVPSMALERLRSFNMYRLATPAPETAVAGVVDLGHEEQPPVSAVERSRSEAAAELPPLPARLRKSASDRSAFAHFQAVTEEQTEAVESRRPATTREPPRRCLDVSDTASESSDDEEGEETEEEASEVDARADDFINKFRHQLKLQRIDSFLRYRELIRRGHAAAASAIGRD
ncbi:hypothetical protein GUJ93_ZPchr0006g44172 [Zizania palustris]|uniref:DUF4408 domain-containing protein n=1 Tax=Zizania palustris TaxID=103762 RepID=A0A8J5SGA4_ZIZPA|nr:hypothetical protein GUJ93_ZPchr0006g44172 [Zizania palustris]